MFNPNPNPNLTLTLTLTSLVDFTPNYLCDADAMARIHRVAGGNARQLRFIVVMRDPVYRAFRLGLEG